MLKNLCKMQRHVQKSTFYSAFLPFLKIKLRKSMHPQPGGHGGALRNHREGERNKRRRTRRRTRRRRRKRRRMRMRIIMTCWRGRRDYDGGSRRERNQSSAASRRAPTIRISNP